MMIVSCHIAGYGKFKDKRIDFKEGLNVLTEDNGWGKSTLCSYIYSMFYGNPASTSRKELGDRKKYAPWDGGPYGGSMVFEVDGKRYRVERMFASRQKDDTFELYDDETNLISEDYSENLGEELFGIDRESFTKSVYVPQSSIHSEMTSAINSKLGDIVTLQDDINNFDVAIKRIQTEISVYKKNSKDEGVRGKILKVQDEIKELAEDVEKLDSFLESQQMYEKLLDDKEEAIAKLRSEKEVLKGQITKQSERDQLTGEYNNIKKTYNEEKLRLDELDDYFASGVPTEEEMEEMFDLVQKVDVLQSRADDIKKNMPSEEKIELLKKLFTEPLEEETINEWKERANRLSELRVQKEHAQLSEEDKNALGELKYYFSKKKPTKEELEIIRNEAENVNRLQGRIEETREYYEQQQHIYEEGKKENSNNNKPLMIMLFIIGSIIFIGSVATIILVNDTLGYIVGFSGMAIALVMFAVSVLINRKRNKISKDLIDELEKNYNEAKEKYEQTKSEYDASNNICKEFLSDYLVNANDTLQQMVSDIELKAERYEALLASEEKAVEAGGNALEELSRLEVELYTELMHYQNCYEMEDLYSSNAEMELILKISEDNKLYITYFNDDKERSEIIEQREVMMKKIAAFLNRFPFTTGENFAQKLGFVITQRRQYEEVASKVAKHEEDIQDVEKDNAEYTDAASVEELQHQQEELDKNIASLIEEINETRNQLRDVREMIDSCHDKANQITELREKELEYNRNVDYLEKTINYLTKAKNNFLSKYMRPMQRGMRNYLERINDKDGALSSDAFRIDTNLNVSVVYEGSSKREEYLSAGYIDVASLCARFALIDIMYDNKKPMVILDDPLTNMDETKIDMALDLLKDLSEEIQILYFTCHSSRA